MLVAENIQKSYKDIEVLKGIDLVIDKGELVSIVGKSGTGKSTLLHILGTLDMPDRGKILIKGTDVNSLNQKKLAEFRNSHIGFVFQFHHLLAEFSAIENVMIPGLIKKRSKKLVHKEAAELLDYLGLSDRLEHKPGQMSGGEQQRVAIARALINKPELVFADEPTGNLDIQTSEELHSLIKDLNKNLDITFVIVTHNEAFANICDRKLVIGDGLIIN